MTDNDTEELGYNPHTILSDKAHLEKVFCFLDAGRVCGAACMAFVTFPVEAKTTELQGIQKHCALLQSVERLGRNVTIIASTLIKRDHRQHVAAQDAQRESSIAQVPFAASPFPRTKP